MALSVSICFNRVWEIQKLIQIKGNYTTQETLKKLGLRMAALPLRPLKISICMIRMNAT